MEGPGSRRPAQRFGHACAALCEEEQQGKDMVKGRGVWARGVDWCAPIVLPPSTSRFVIHQQVSRKLERGVGFSKVTPSSGVAELRSGREAGGPSRRSSGQQLAAGCCVPARGEHSARGTEHMGPHALRSH